MALSRLAAEFAAEIKQHDWQDAPYRTDRAGHSWERDSHRPSRVLDPGETASVRMNVVWVVAQVLGYHDPNFSVVEFVEAAGVQGFPDGWINAGVRTDFHTGRYQRPGTYEFDAQPTG
jgi:hypothetical protein